jgi:predicted nucleic acid-binding protein
MTFADIPPSIAVFLDANTFVYHFISEPTYGAACTSLLERIARQEIEGWSSPHVLAEVSHRLMTIEACSLFGWPYQGIAARLRNHPQQLQQLRIFHRALSEIVRMDLHMATVTATDVVQAASLARQYGTLTNDALLVVLMLNHGLSHLASNDAHFDRVPGISRYAPV